MQYSIYNLDIPILIHHKVTFLYGQIRFLCFQKVKWENSTEPTTHPKDIILREATTHPSFGDLQAT